MNLLPHFISGSQLNPVWGSPDVPVAILSDPLTWLLSPRTISTSLVWYPVLHSAPASWAQWHWLSCFWLIVWGYHASVQGFGPQHCALHTRKVIFEESFPDQQQLGVCEKCDFIQLLPELLIQKFWGWGGHAQQSLLMDFQIIFMMLKFKNDRYRKFPSFL